MITVTVFDYLAKHGGFHAFAAVAKIVGFDKFLAEHRDFTLFAPTDKAFASVPFPILDNLFAEPDQLLSMVAFHTLPERFTRKDILTLDRAETLSGKRFTIIHGALSVNGARILETDLECANGVIHAVSEVLWPEKTRMFAR